MDEGGDKRREEVHYVEDAFDQEDEQGEDGDDDVEGRDTVHLHRSVSA